MTFNSKASVCLSNKMAGFFWEHIQQWLYKSGTHSSQVIWKPVVDGSRMTLQLLVYCSYSLPCPFHRPYRGKPCHSAVWRFHIYAMIRGFLAMKVSVPEGHEPRNVSRTPTSRSSLETRNFWELKGVNSTVTRESGAWSGASNSLGYMPKCERNVLQFPNGKICLPRVGLGKSSLALVRKP